MKIGAFTGFRVFLLGLVLVVVALAVCIFRSSRLSAKEIRHILLISIDTCRADHLGCYGYPRKTSPNIDTLAAEAVLFNNAFTPVPITLASHSSMLTGTIPPYHKVRENTSYRLGSLNLTLAEILQKKGFVTGAVVGAFVLDSQFGLDQGFDTYNDELKEEENVLFTFNERSAEEVTEVAKRWLDERRNDDFFLFIHYFDPHASYKWHRRFPFTSVSGRHGLIDGYDSEIAYTDFCIGQVIKKLEDLGLYDSTLLIITADHGESLGDHSEKTHGYFIYNSTLRVPLIVKVPAGPEGKKIDEIVSLIDIVPTVCGFLGISVPSHVQGRDLSVLFAGESDCTDDRYLYCESLMPTVFGLGPFLGLVSNRWKYIHTLNPELFDLANDSQESRNLLEQQPDQARIMRDRLELILRDSALSSVTDSKMTLDEESRKRLATLGYVSSRAVDDSINLDEMGANPKEYIEAYNFISKCLGLSAAGKIEQAKKLCNDMLARRPDMAQARFYLGLIAVSEEDTQATIKHFSRYLAHTESNPDGSYNRAKLDYQYAVAHTNLGNVFQNKGQFEQAVEHYKKALAYIPYMARAGSSLGAAYTLLGKHDLAVACLTEIIRLVPDCAEALNNLAWVLATTKDTAIHNPAEAVKLAREACELTDYNDPDLLDTLSEAYAAAGRFREAVQSAEKAMDLALSANKHELAASIKTRIQRYKRGRD